ncbi:MAG: FAD-dependent oxidoreductase, partial [Desulfobacteraceae bacterium]|nr:FAD-dependent oxidoreductase [Desulfobacteraceae bacterium]
MAKKEIYDLIVIGSGPGGYVASVRAAQLGLKTACIEKEARLGGVCLNVGCIPSKALLDSSEYYHLAKDHLAEHGIKTGKLTVDLSAMMARKEQVVKELTGNVHKLLEGNNIEIFKGTARLAGEDRVELRQNTGSARKKTAQTLQAKSIILATGSSPVQVPGLEFDGKRIVTSTEALEFKTVPKHLGIVGGGYIGLELGSVWLRLGAKVTVVEMLPQIATTMDGQVG